MCLMIVLNIIDVLMIVLNIIDVLMIVLNIKPLPLLPGGMGGGKGGLAPPNGCLCPSFRFTLNIVFETSRNDKTTEIDGKKEE